MKRLGAAVVAAFIAAGCTSAKPQVTTSPATPTPGTTSAATTGAPSSSATAGSSPAAAGPTATATPTASTTVPGPAAALAPYYQQRLDWTDCSDGFSCASAAVPLDYAQPSGRQITIAMIKLPARKPKTRIGSLFLNPGGPGGSGIDYARYAESVIPSSVRNRFDIVGFDPRGVGKSSPVRCATSAQLDAFLSPDPSPDTPAELAQLVSAARAFAAECAKRSGPLLSHIGTRDAARDMDILRAAVGDEKLTYLGKSYGTYLGALYADLFPQRVRALILDGAVDPTVDTQTLGRVQARGFEVALKAFLDDCAKSATCDFGTAPDIRGRFDALLAKIDGQPLRTDEARSVGPDETFYAVAEALYSRQYGWPALRLALAQAAAGDGTGLLSLFDRYVDRDSAGNYSNLIESYTAISCIDRPSPRDLAAYQADARAQSAESPHFGVAAAFSGLPCAFWPVPPVGGPAPLPARGAPPILVMGTTRDPATPLVWAQALAKQLESGRLLTFNGDGHTVYGDGNACVDNAGNAYLIDLKVPATGKRCG